MATGKQTTSKGAAGKDKAKEFLAKRKIPRKNQSGKADSKLALRSNGVEKHKKHADKDNALVLFMFQRAFDREFRKKNPNVPVDRAYLDAAAADKWKTMSDLDKALYVARIKKGYDEFLAQKKNLRKNESAKADSKLTVRSNGVEKHKKPAAKDTGQTTALFFFQDFREKNPNAPVNRAYLDAAAVDKWKTMSDLDKAPYVARQKGYEQGRAMTMEMVQMMQEMKM